MGVEAGDGCDGGGEGEEEAGVGCPLASGSSVVAATSGELRGDGVPV